MKAIKKIIIWSVIALLLESIVFFAVDRYYEVSLLNTKTSEVKFVEKDKPIKNVDIYIPSDAAKLSASYDGNYISYYENNQLIVVSTSDGTKHIVSVNQNCSQVYSSWLPDADSMILCEASLEQNRLVKIYTYNADNDTKLSATDTNNANIEIKLNSTKDKIQDVEISTIMCDSYIKILKNNYTNDIFYNNVNGQTSTIFRSSNIGTIKVFKNKPGMVYEDLDSNAIKITGIKKDLYRGSSCLLNTDDNNNVYIGIIDNGKVTKIIYGPTERTVTEWNSINLDTPVDKSNICVTTEGKIYIINSSEHYILDKSSNKKINYTGDLLEITSENLMYVDNGKLQKKKIN
jgi:hypothetical protein